MMNRDYVMRIIEQFVQSLVTIIKARKAKNFEEAFHQIQNASQRYLYADVLTFLKMNPEQLLEYFKENGKYLDVEQSIICGNCFHGELLKTNSHVILLYRKVYC